MITGAAMEELERLYRERPTARWGRSWLARGMPLFWVLLGVALGTMLWRNLPWGAWARTDSVAYVEAARHVASGQGLYVYDEQGNLEWLAHYPPFYSVSLAPFLKAGLPWHQATRWDAALTYGLLVTLLGLIAWHISRRWLESFTWTVLLALTPPLVVYISGAMSEGWFYVWMWVAVFGWWLAQHRGRATALWWAGLAAGLALLTRYAGLFLLGGAGLMLLGFPGSRRARVAAALRFAFPMLSLYGIWNLLMALHGKGVRTRWAWQVEPWVQAAQQFRRDWPAALWRGWAMMYPPRYEAYAAQLDVLAWVVLAALVLVTLVAALRYRQLRPWANLETEADGVWRRERLTGWWLWTALTGAGALGYLLFLYIARVVRDPQPDFTPRVLSPALFLGLAAGIAGVQALVGEGVNRLAAQGRGRTARLLPLAVSLFLLGGFWFWVFPKTSTYLHSMRKYGNGYSRKMWHEPEFWDYVRSWPEDILLLSTEAYAVRIWTGRFAAWPREAFYPQLLKGPLGSNPDDPYHRAFVEGRAVLIHLRPAGETWWRARWGPEGYRASKVIRTGLPRCYEHPLAIVYFAGKDPERCPLQRRNRSSR